MTDWSFGSCLVALFGGAILSTAYLSILWLSARKTIHWRTLFPWGVGMALRLALLIGGFAVLAAWNAEPPVKLSALTGFVVACWATLAVITYAADPRQKGQE